MKKLWQDIRYAFRMLIKNPGFALIAIITLAIGIGANAAIFSVVSSLLLRPYPFKDPDQLVVLRMANLKRGISDVDMSYGDYTVFKERNRSFQEVALFTLRRFNFSDTGEAIQLKGAATTANIFSVTGGQAILGRTFTPDEDRPGSKVVVLNQGLWQQSFGSDANVIGKQVRLNGEAYTVIGVVPAEAQFPDTSEADLFVPLAMDPAQAPKSRNHFALARLKNDVTVAQAQSDLSGVATQAAQEHPDTNDSWGVQVAMLRDYRTKDGRSPLMILFGAVGLVLLIACVNVANLLLQRGAARQQEMAVRSALGASTSRLLQQLFTESLVIALMASGLGLFLAYCLLKLIVTLIPAEELPGYLNSFQPDATIIIYLLTISVVTAVLFGLVPALRIIRPELTAALKDTGRSSTQGAKRQRLRSALVISEVALSLMLLIAAGLMVQSFQRMQRVDLGYDPGQTMAVEFALPEARYKEPATRIAFYQQLVERVHNLPGVQTVGAGTRLPIGDWLKSIFFAEGQLPEEQKSSPVVDIQSISGDYFQSVGVNVIKGRAFTLQDGATAPPVIVVNESVARRFWPDQDPIGKRVKIAQSQPNWMTVVGVVNNTQRGVFNNNSTLEVYTPYAQRTRGDMVMFVRAGSDPLALTGSVRNQLSSIDPDLAVTFRTIKQASDQSMWDKRFLSSLFGLFAMIAVVLAAIGIYGTIAYSVTQRTHEIGIRMALGARDITVLNLIMRQGTVLTVIGIILGIGGAFALTRLISSLLFGVGSSDPLTFTGAALLLGIITLLATLIPAFRATRIEPTNALRHS
jgi:putative ABC transport system permease protein